MHGSVTIADLVRDGKLGIGCLGCGPHVYVDPAVAGPPDSLPVPNAAARLACSGCGAIKQPNWHPIYEGSTRGHQGCYSARTVARPKAM